MFLNHRRTVFAGLLVALVVTTAPAAPVPPERARVEKELALQAAKLHGAWIGGPCEGRFTFRADGTYEWRDAGPTANVSTGNWSVRGDSMALALVLKCTEADDPDQENKTTAMKFVWVDDKNFTLAHPERENPMRFARGMKEPSAP